MFGASSELASVMEFGFNLARDRFFLKITIIILRNAPDLRVEKRGGRIKNSHTKQKSYVRVLT